MLLSMMTQQAWPGPAGLQASWGLWPRTFPGPRRNRVDPTDTSSVGWVLSPGHLRKSGSVDQVSEPPWVSVTASEMDESQAGPMCAATLPSPDLGTGGAAHAALPSACRLGAALGRMWSVRLGGRGKEELGEASGCRHWPDFCPPPRLPGWALGLNLLPFPAGAGRSQQSSWNCPLRGPGPPGPVLEVSSEGRLGEL